MKTLGSFYFCNQCKKVGIKSTEIVFVEQIHYYTFCSEKCIVEFYSPIVSYFDNLLKEWKKELSLEKESSDLLASQHYLLVEKALKKPDEIWVVGGDNLTEELHVLIAHPDQGEKDSLILVTLLFEGTPSFVILEVYTKSQELMEKFRQGRKIEQSEIKKDISVVASEQEMQSEFMTNIPINEDILNRVESKRGELLNDYLKDRSEEDISMEEFHLYEIHLGETLKFPDEVYINDEKEEVFYTYIKALENHHGSFYYIVVSLQYSEDALSAEQTLIPVFSFPTKDPNLHKKYRKGKQLEGHSLL